jgi:hypothetical protein
MFYQHNSERTRILSDSGFPREDTVLTEPNQGDLLIIPILRLSVFIAWKGRMPPHEQPHLAG